MPEAVSFDARASGTMSTYMGSLIWRYRAWMICSVTQAWGWPGVMMMRMAVGAEEAGAARAPRGHRDSGNALKSRRRSMVNPPVLAAVKLRPLNGRG